MLCCAVLHEGPVASCCTCYPNIKIALDDIKARNTQRISVYPLEAFWALLKTNRSSHLRLYLVGLLPAAKGKGCAISKLKHVAFAHLAVYNLHQHQLYTASSESTALRDTLQMTHGHARLIHTGRRCSVTLQMLLHVQAGRHWQTGEEDAGRAGTVQAAAAGST